VNAGTVVKKTSTLDAKTANRGDEHNIASTGVI